MPASQPSRDLLLPSKWSGEGVPGALVESKMAGIAAIVSDWNFNAEIVKNDSEGISYLYLADTIETCLAEVHLQIGQNCSVGKFKCKQEIEVIDLTKFNGDLEMEIWLEIMTQPVHMAIMFNT